MADDTQQLLVSLEARVTNFEKAFQRATKLANDNWSAIEQRGKQAASNLDAQFANVGKRSLRSTPKMSEALDTSDASAAAKLTGRQFQILGAAARRAFDAMAAGASPLKAIAQEAGHVTAALGEDGVLGLVQGIGGSLGGLVSPTTAAAAAIVAIGAGAAYAFSKVTQENLAIELALTGIGRASGTSVQGIRAIGDEVANVSKISTASARDIATAIAGTGKVQGDNIGGVANLAAGYSKLFGTDLAEAGKQLGAIFSDPAKGADQLDARLGSLDDQTRQYIRTLAEQGDRQGAIKALISAVQPELARAASLTSAWARAWDAVKNAAGGAVDAVGKAVAGPSLDQLAASTERQRRQLESQKAGRSDSPLLSNPVATGSDDKALSIITAEAEALNELTRRTSQLEKARTDAAQANDASKMAGDIVRSFNDEAAAIQSLQDHYEALGKALSDPNVVDKLANPDAAKATYDALGKKLEEITADFKAGGAAAAAALRAANFSAATAGLSTYAKGLAAINHEYDEQIRLARQSGDAATTAARVATLEQSRGAAVGAYNRDNVERAKASTILPSDYVQSVIGAESSGDDKAKNTRSSATGAGQFIAETWLTLFKKTFSEEGAAMSDQAILALRTNRDYSTRLIEEYAHQNALALQQAGFAATSANLQLAHFLGAGGAVKMLQADPSANAASILPKAAASNPEVFKNGSASVSDVLAYAQRRATGGAANQGQQSRLASIRAEAEAYDQSAEKAEKLKAIEEALATDREKGGDLSKAFASAQDLISASSEKLTPALQAQRTEILALADARAKAAGTGLSARFNTDVQNAREALGRTSGDQQIYQQVKGYGYDPSSSEGQAATEALKLNSTLADLKTTSSSALSGFVSDLMHGTNAAQALQNQLLKIADKLISMAADQLVSAAFGGLGGGSGSSSGAGGLFGSIGQLLGIGGGSAVADATMWLADGGHVAGPGSSTSDSIPAMLSNGEFVVNAAATKKHGALLAAINSGRVARLATGGMVGPAATSSKLSSGAAAGTNVTQAVTVNMHAQGGNPQQNADLANKTAKAVQDQIKGMIGSELNRQLRPGGILNGARR